MSTKKHTPWYHEPAMRHMRENPGTSYEAACQFVQTHHESPRHLAAMVYIRDNPGTMYDDAVAAVTPDGKYAHGVLPSVPKSPLEPSAEQLNRLATEIMRKYPGMTYAAAESFARNQLIAEEIVRRHSANPEGMTKTSQTLTSGSLPLGSTTFR